MLLNCQHVFIIVKAIRIKHRKVYPKCADHQQVRKKAYLWEICNVKLLDNYGGDITGIYSEVVLVGACI